MAALTPQQRERKIDEAILLLRRARTLLDAVHTDYAAVLGRSEEEQSRWREVIELVGPLDRLYESGRLDR